ncbi:MAG TPA: metallophosphoesterase [Solirubrobacteraceae bacterium]
MIDRALNRDFVLRQAELIRRELDRQAESESLGAADDGVVAARDALDASLKRENAGAESVTGADPVSDKVWVPRDMMLSLVQSVLEQAIRDRHPELLRDADGREAAGGPIATQVVVEDDLEGAGDFTTDDPGWISVTARAVAARLLRGRHHFVHVETPPEEALASDARVILIGDWANDAPSARAVGAMARREMESAGDREVHVVHLGDVYYAGEEDEVQERMLDPWPVRRGEEGRYRSWSLMGNHDMYGGGHAYYDVLLADPRFARQRTAEDHGISYFALANEHWQILGIDTAWDDHLITHQGHDGYLQDPQGKWIAGRVRDGRARKRRTMLLSHHQLYSTHDKVKGNLAKKLAPAFEAGGLDAWFWGHEHRCQTFAPRPEVRYAACVGHGAMPEAVGHADPEPGEWEFDQGGPDADGDQWRWCGLAVLDFAGERVHVRYLAEHVGQIGEDHLPEG